MEDPERPRQRQPVRLIMGWVLGASTLACFGEPVAIRPNWQVAYPPALNGRAAESTAVPLSGGLLVAVVLPGADAMRPVVRLGGREVPARALGYDPVSSLVLLSIGDGAPPRARAIEWRDAADGAVGVALQAITPDGAVRCRATGWVKQVGVKVLPLALLRVTFDDAVPSPGTPLLDPEGRVAAIVFQAVGNGGVEGYAIPAEAVHRVRRDLSNGGQLVRGWLGLTLRAEVNTPKIVKVLPNSPAAAAGIRPADVLLRVGPHRIADYADAANAFFYLIPGQPVRMMLMRGTKPLEFTVTPTRPQAE